MSRRAVIQALGTTIALGLVGTLLCPSSRADEIRADQVAVEAVAQARFDLHLGFTVPGQVSEVLVEPGQHVESGTVLIRLDDRESRALIEIQQARAENDLEVRSAGLALDLARNEEASVREAYERAGASLFELRRAELRTKQSELAFEKAQTEITDAKRQLALARIRAEAFVIRSPITGIVEEIAIAPAELAEAHKPVIRVVSPDPLWIEAFVPLVRSSGIREGIQASVQFSSVAGTPTRAGKVLSISSIGDAGSETVRVRVELPNPDGLPAGSRVLVTFTNGSTP